MERVEYTKIPDELEIIHRNDDGCEAINMTMSTDDYEVRDDADYLDDIEDDLDWRHKINETDSYEVGDDEFNV